MPTLVVRPASFSRRPPDLDATGLRQQQRRSHLLDLGKPNVLQQLGYELVGFLSVEAAASNLSVCGDHSGGDSVEILPVV